VDLALVPLPNGLTELKKTVFTAEQKKYLKQEIIILFACRNEDLKPVVCDVWIDTFQLMQIPYNDLIEMLRVARLTKRYGNNTTLADIVAETVTEENGYKDIHNRYFKYLEIEKFTYLIHMPCNHDISYTTKPDKAHCVKCEKSYDVTGEFVRVNDGLMEITLE